MFDVEYTNQSANFLKNSHTKLTERIAKKIESLRSNPLPANVKRIQGADAWCVRIGDYRILYTINHNEQIIVIAKIDKRSNVYK